ncbi:TonB-dependent receptor [uncultured Ferrimonas sp.]|uniref:TonB-dependent receptor plug domain-containing protein n=1 Tax=uncultured Ferrimonas sp. TaxID=432640 RepID=UPI002613244C|nr:TonB-dependent receptor [uncultured Ferrimonas sp.]
MLNTNTVSKAVRFALIAGATTAAMTTAPVAFAAEGDEVERIEVTGSRIKRVDMEGSSPVAVITAEEIKATGITRIEDFLNDMPQIFAGQTSGLANGATGTATVDLRGLGSTRTLVLVNGRRLPSGSPAAGGIGADVNQIPAAFVERIEVLTGGASATYGSDAVAGVVNFILKDDFEGFQFDYQYSFYQHDNDNGTIQGLLDDNGFAKPSGNVTDGYTNDFTFMLGANTADGRGNVAMYGSYRDIDAVSQSNRDYSACALFPSADGGVVCGGSSTIPEGRFTDFGAAVNGNSFDFMVAGDEFVDRNGTQYNYGPLNYFQRPDERMTLGAIGKYELNEYVELYSEVMFMDDRSVAQIAPSGAFFVTDSLNCDNPLMSDQQRQAICFDDGLTVDDSQNAFIGRRNVEGGPRQDDLRHTSWRGVFGARGLINDDWSYDAFFNYGTVSYVETYRNELSITNIGRALNVVADADGNAVCQSVVDGSDPNCVPWNIFQEGGVTQEAIDYLVKPLYSRGETESIQVAGIVTGDLTSAGVVLPTASDGVGLAVGLEYRNESLLLEPDSGFTSGDGAGQGGPTAGVEGSFNVKEIFGEVSIPLVQDMAMADSLTLELAYRYSDYSTDKETNTYKYAMDWRPIQDLLVRGSFQRAVRAGNIRDLFRPQTLGLFNMDSDPCSGPTPEYTFEQCARTGVTAAQYGSIADSPAGQYNSITGGNPDLDPEESDTVSFGISYSPEYIEGLAITLDYFDIEVDKAISNVSERYILDQCALENNQQFCDLVNRGATTGTLWVGQDNILSTDINIGRLSTTGVDYDVNYNFTVGEMGDIKLNLVGTWLDSYEIQNTPEATPDQCVGFWDRTTCGSPTPEWRTNLRGTWVTPWDVNATAAIRFVGEVDELGDGPTSIDSQTYLDLQTTWQATDNLTLNLGINNLLDEEPPIIGNAPSGIGNGNTFPGTYDALGRYIFAGASLKF